MAIIKTPVRGSETSLLCGNLWAKKSRGGGAANNPHKKGEHTMGCFYQPLSISIVLDHCDNKCSDKIIIVVIVMMTILPGPRASGGHLCVHRIC